MLVNVLSPSPSIIQSLPIAITTTSKAAPPIIRSVVERLDRNELVEATAELNAEAAVVAVVLAVDPLVPDGV